MTGSYGLRTARAHDRGAPPPRARPALATPPQTRRWLPLPRVGEVVQAGPPGLSGSSGPAGLVAGPAGSRSRVSTDPGSIVATLSISSMISSTFEACPPDVPEPPSTANDRHQQ